jgi:ABC-type branched-subunit amino acid transport system ATPase component
MAFLQVSGLIAGYGETEILHGVSVAVDPGEIVAIIGPNGSGKSTLLKALLGLLHPTSGTIVFRDQDITGAAPEDIVRRGICYVPQSANVFPSLTVRENLEMGGFLRNGDVQPRIAQLYELFPGLAGRGQERAGRLSGGQRQMLALARALMLDPELLLLDEPTAGLSPQMVTSVFDQIASINASGVAILLVEQNALEALNRSSRGYVLAAGRNRLEDKGENLLNDPEVARLYLGG